MFETRQSRLATGVLAAGLLCAPLASHAVTIPHQFEAGDPVLAEQLNENFDALRLELEQEPLHLSAAVVPVTVPTDDQWHELQFEEPSFDNTGGVIAGPDTWFFEVPADGVYLVHLTVAGNYANFDGSLEGFLAARVLVDGQIIAESMARADASCCVRRTTASAARWLEAGTLMYVEVQDFLPVDFDILGISTIDITRVQ